MTGARQKIDAAIETFSQFGIREISTGTTALARGTAETAGPGRPPRYRPPRRRTKHKPIRKHRPMTDEFNTEIYYDDDVDESYLANTTVAVLGYGSQATHTR